MLPKIKMAEALDGFILKVTFDDNKTVKYDVSDDIKTIQSFSSLKTEYGLWKNFQIDESRTCIFWSEFIDLASDTIYEYGIPA